MFDSTNLHIQVAIVPLTCPQSPLTLKGKSSSVSLCRCENVWLKAVDGQRGSVELGLMTCGIAATTDEILQQQCQQPSGIQYMKMKRMVF